MKTLALNSERKHLLVMRIRLHFTQLIIKQRKKKKLLKSSKGEILIDKGSFLNDAIIYDNFTELPILIDNYRLSKASNAYSRQLAEDRLPSNRINSTVKDITSGNLLGNMQSGNLQGTQGKFL